MKIRNGFVSNSSSSSFVVARKYFSNIWDLAWQMIALRNWDNDANLIETLMNRMNHNDIEIDIVFPTCNFDTYIHIEGDNFWISTCNNHPFYKLFVNKPAVGDLPQTVKSKIPDGCGSCYDYDLLDYIEFQMEKEYNFVEIKNED